MSYPRPFRTRSISQIYSGKLHQYGINVDRPILGYQPTGALRHLFKLRDFAETNDNSKVEAKKEKKELTPEELEAQKQKESLEINERLRKRKQQLDQLEAGPHEIG